MRKMIFQIVSVAILCLIISFVFAETYISSETNGLLGAARRADLPANVLALGVKAYNNARKLGDDKQEILTIIDYQKPSNEKRLWVIDMKNHKILYHELVAHGKGSGMDYATKFSDKPQSDASSIGVFLTGNTYTGHHGCSLRLIGLDKGYNDQAFKRAVVMHSAWYVSDSFLKEHGRLGRSWGCPALDKQVCQQIIDTIKNGSVILAYYPDQTWISSSKMLA